MTSAFNRRAITDLYDAFLRHDPSYTPAAYDDHTVWVEPGDNLRSGVFRGVSKIVEHTANCRRLTDGTLGTEVLDTLAGDRFVVVIERNLALRNGTSLNVLCSTVYEMTDGVVTEGRLLPFDPVAWDAFWS